MATELISPPQKPAPSEVWQGPATPPLKGLGRYVDPPGISLHFCVEIAWRWRGDGVLPAGPDIDVCRPSEAVMQEMVRLDPIAAGILRQQREEIIRDGKEGVTHRFIDRVLKLIANQYGWPEQD